MRYSCQINDAKLICTITSDRDISAPVFHFSGMAPMIPLSGGTLIYALGSYTEVQLPDLSAGAAHEITIAYRDGFTPSNRAWMPLGPYLKSGSEVITLPPTDAGVRPQPAAPKAALTILPLVPQPTHWDPTKGVLKTTGFTSDDPALTAVAALADRQNTHFTGPTPVTFVTDDRTEDAYALTITPDTVTIHANSYGGRFYAGITLLTLLRDGPIPCGMITDAPRFGWRGQHLDTARHYYEPNSILTLLDLMAMLKLNRFHWHFADDEAFRLEIPTLPEVWQKTALRGEGQTLPAIFAGAPTSGGTYSIATAQDVIAHAKALNIEVMPEIETPAHALALTTLFPDTRDPGDNGTEISVQGYHRNALNPAMPRTWEVLETIVKDVAAIFPFNHLHLGCDELPKDTWMSSPRARALMAEHGLETTEDLQGWTIAKLASFATDLGKRPAAWEEAAQGTQGGIGNNAVLFSWTGQGPGLEAARAGYDVVMCPAQNLYFDMAQSDDVDDWGANWAAVVGLADTINWDPVPDPALSQRIIGVQGAFWSEFTTQDDQMWPMLMPRLLGLAMTAWQDEAPAVPDLVALATHYAIDRTGRLTSD